MDFNFGNAKDYVFLESELTENPILRFFSYDHLPGNLQMVSAPFTVVACFLLGNCPPSAERTVAFRKLLEAKDCAVRAVV